MKEMKKIYCMLACEGSLLRFGAICIHIYIYKTVLTVAVVGTLFPCWFEALLTHTDIAERIKLRSDQDLKYRS